ncbi:MAG: enoyl-CoA hydratase/isomerase family protein [Dehalococcoidia bacterium]|nr:enoyl-CoA hydratase/isomerase family protein [Dehalococcoidia bacterium]
MSSSVSLEQRGSVALVRFRGSGPGNAIGAGLVRELAEACETIAADAGVRVALLTAEGQVFCSGWDWSALAGLPAGKGGEDRPGEGWPSAAHLHGLLDDPFGCLAELTKPVVCAVNGDAISAGLALALACDLRVAAEDAAFALPETALGLLPMGGATQRLARLVGRGKALEMVLTGETIDAREALRVGLVGAVAPRRELLARAEAIAQAIAERGPIALQYAKEAVARGAEMPLEQALRFETDLTIILQTTEDRAEGVSAFLEKRKPEFKGR